VISFWNRASRAARFGLLSVAYVSLAGPVVARDRVDRYGIDGWIVTLRHDGFTGLVTCTMRSSDGRMLYQPGAIGFQLGRRRDTLDAWYRLDVGPALRWRDRYPALIAADVAIDGSGLDNPTGGTVWLPEADVARVQEVTIRSTRKARPQTFHLGGFAPLRDAAQRLGCWQQS
jgi:hypothetical protein